MIEYGSKLSFNGGEMPKFGKYERQSDIAYACGVFPCIEFMRCRPQAARALLLSEDIPVNSGARKLLEICRNMGIRVETAPRAIERICGKENCSAVIAFEKYAADISESALHVVLHNISDLGNLGTILRTCLGFGVTDVALIKPCADLFSPQSVRASMGAVFALNAAAFESFDAYEARFPGRSMYFFRLKNAVTLQNVQASSPASLVFGNEARGLPDELCARESGVFIPHGSRIDSLNLAVAAGIGIAHFAQKLGIVPV